MARLSTRYLWWENDNLHLQLSVQPRARRDEVVGLHNNRLRLRITAPPIDGKANRHLCAFLAGQFGVPRRQVQLVAGAGHREKSVVIVQPTAMPAWLETLS